MAADKRNPLEELLVGEVAGKSNAIHAYDDILWKIRTGYLTVLFAAWAILLKGIAESTGHTPQGFEAIITATLFFTVGLALSGWLIDRSYVRRKYRVIAALNQLTDAIADAGGNIAQVPKQLLRISADDPEISFVSKGYKEEIFDASCVFFVPVLTLALAAGSIVAFH